MSTIGYINNVLIFEYCCDCRRSMEKVNNRDNKVV